MQSIYLFLYTLLNAILQYYTNDILLIYLFYVNRKLSVLFLVYNKASNVLIWRQV